MVSGGNMTKTGLHKYRVNATSSNATIYATRDADATMTYAITEYSDVAGNYTAYPVTGITVNNHDIVRVTIRYVYGSTSANNYDVAIDVNGVVPMYDIDEPIEEEPASP